MTTQSWSTRVRHDSDATYQEWRDEFITRLNALVSGGALVADETNITPAAGARPGTSTEEGYAVYHLDDPLHGTAPVYIRFGFGTGSGATSPRIQITVGTSTNGSGVLGGTALSTIATCNAFSAQTTDVGRQSYMCGLDGFFGFEWKVASNSQGAFFVARTVDNDGVPTAEGALIRVSDGAQGVAKSQAFRYASPAAAYTAQTAAPNAAIGINPQTPTQTTVGADIQVALGWTISPRATPLVGVCGVLPSEITPGSTFTATLVGAGARTYLAWSANSGPFGAVSATAAGGMVIAMLWE